ncbi:MAG: hypothetical protein RSG22_12155 [Comamonas sp.]
MYTLRYIFLISISLGFMHSPWAKEFRYPGKELVGIWRVVRHDLSEFPQPISQEVTDALVNQSFFQPPGQLIEITFDGIYETCGAVRWAGTDKKPYVKAPQLIFRTIPPLSQDLCKFGWWKRAICENGSMPPSEEVKTFYAVFVVPKNKKPPRPRRVEWPDASTYEYFLSGEQPVFNVRMLKNNRLLFMFVEGPEPAAYETAGTVYSVWEKLPLDDKK